MKALCGLVRALTLALLSLCLLGLRGSRAASLAGLGDSDAMLGPEQLGGVANFSTFLLDRSSGVLFLGGRDAILAVNTNNMAAQPRKIVWNVPEEKRKSCVGKGKTEGDCNNYIRLLEFLGDGRIYACGTYAFDPQCAFLNMSSFSLERGEDGGVKMETGKGKCPFEPSQHYTAVMADGVLYTAATSNFLGTLFDISRATGPEQERIRTERSINWLSDPEFVSSAFIEQSETGDGDDDNIYFFFTEVAKEYDLYTKVKVPRVARVCKADVGGMKTLQRRWTTFLKAQLVCEERGGGRRYNILTDVFTARTPGEPRSTLFYGLFTSQWEREELSAVCVYSLADISSVMDGPFKELKKTCENWINPEPVPTPRPGQCLNAALRAEGFESSLKLPDKVLTFMRDHPLMENSVVAAPLLVRRGVTYTKLAVTRPTVAPGDESNPAVLHLGTDRGELHRVAVVGLNTTLLQEEELFSAQEPVNNILLHKGDVLVGSPRALARRGAEGCALYSSCEVCSLAWALGCVWRAKEEACTHRLTGSGPGDEAEALRLCHGGGEGRCSASVRELRVSLGLRLLLQCVQVSPLPCSWEHPPHRHTRQHHSHLEVNVTAESLGTYTCICQEAGSGGRDSTPCRRAAYELSLEGPSVGGAVALAGGRHVLAGYILSFSAGAIFSGILLYILSRRRGNRGRPGIGGDNSEKGRDLSASSATPLSPSSASLLSEAVPLTEKRNGNAGGGGGHHTGNGGHYGGNLLHRHGNGNSNGGYANVNSNANVGVVGGVALPSGLAEEGEESEMSLGLDDAFPEAILKSKAPLAPCEESSI